MFPTRSTVLLIAFLIILGILFFLFAGKLIPPKVNIAWSTASELDTAGFKLARGDAEDGPFTELDTGLIPAQGDEMTGAEYTFTDTHVQPGHLYYYQLLEISTNGSITPQGVVSASVSGFEDPRWLAWIFFGGALLLLVLNRKPDAG